MTIILIVTVSTSAYGGFFGDVLSTATANYITSDSDKSNSTSDSNSGSAVKTYVETNDMKIQRALHGLYFYHSSYDGDLNTMDSRTAISELQKSFGLKESGILKSTTKQHLLYLSTLYINLKKLGTSGSQKRYQIYDEVDKVILLIKGEN